MERETLPSTRRAPRLPRALVLLLLPVASCFGPESVDCPSGLVCAAGQRCSAAGDACIQTDCGDGIIQAGEACDDGNLKDGDGCNQSCTSKEVCGNGIVDQVVGEVCDDGNTQNGDGCTADCVPGELCGNGIVDTAAGEKCDDGNTRDSDGCNANCLSDERCGNGYLDIASGEVCDDGNTQNGDGCSSDCRSPGLGCGNGILEPGEHCDDGNKVNEDDCLNTCEVNTCGDGFVDKQFPGIEQCDGRGESGSCNINCTWAKCGDGIVNARAGEVCDDGNALACGTCNQNCTQWQDMKATTGSIIALPRDAFNDGEKLYISDGRKSRTFEFDMRNDGCSVSSFCVKLHDQPEPDQVADALARKITSADFDIKVTSILWNVVKLENKVAGPAGNQAITHTVNHWLFRVEGMAGGSGEGCQKDVSCRINMDCVPGLQCKEGRCQP